MEQLKLPFENKFKRGDWVMIMSKSMGDPLGVGWAQRFRKGDEGKIGEIKIVSNLTIVYIGLPNRPKDGTTYYTVRGGCFLGKDLRLIHGE